MVDRDFMARERIIVFEVPESEAITCASANSKLFMVVDWVMSK